MAVKSYKELILWQRAHYLVIEIYKMTSEYPLEEKYGLVSQIRRAAVSVTSNIVEGFTRKSNKESLRFYNISDASLAELSYQLLLSRDLNFISNDKFLGIEQSCVEVGKLLNGWMKSQVLSN